MQLESVIHTLFQYKYVCDRYNIWEKILMVRFEVILDLYK